MPVYTDKVLVYENGKAKEIDEGDSVRVTTELGTQQLYIMSTENLFSANGQVRYVDGEGFKFYEEGVIKTLGGTPTLQTAYNGGNLLTLTANRDFEIAQPVSGAASITLTANGASAWTVNGANLDFNVTGLEAQLGLGTTGGPIVIGSGANLIASSTTSMTVTAGTALNLNAGGAIGIGNNADNQNISIGSAGARLIQLGNITSGTAVGIAAASNLTLTGAYSGTGLVNIRSYGNLHLGTENVETTELTIDGGSLLSLTTRAVTATSTIELGSGISDRSDIINIGATSKNQTITVGNTSASTNLYLQAGASANLQSPVTVLIGNSPTTSGTVGVQSGTGFAVTTGSGSGTIALGVDFSTTTINIGTGGINPPPPLGGPTTGVARAITIGNIMPSGSVLLVTGKSGLTLDGLGASLWNSDGNVTISQSSWVSPSFESAWADVGGGWMPCGFYKDAQGFVHIRGLAYWDTGMSLPYDTTIFYLPPGYWPSATIQIPIRCGTGVLSYVGVDASGMVFTGAIEADAATGITLDNIHFDTR